MTLDRILASLNPEQAAAAAAQEGPVLVLAGAGTGKTRVITYRIAGMLAGGIPGDAILGLTFTNKAAREMRERLAQLVSPEEARRVTLGTFHSFCVRLLRREITRLGYLPNFTIADESDQQGLLKQAIAALGLRAEGFPLAEGAAMIGRWKNRLMEPGDARRAAEFEFEIAAASLYTEYQSMLEMQNMVDFDDMLLLVFRLFSSFPEVLEQYRERYRYLLVDEYQDTNDAQFTIVKMLAGERRNLCVVGDDDQSIYSWRGANVSNILDFPNYFPGAKVVKLEQNYRSTSRILEAANAVISRNSDRHEKALWSQLGEGEPVTVVAASGGETEADFVASMIKQEVANHGRRYRDFAVLYRSNHLSRQLEQTLRQHGVPYRLVGGQEFFKRKEIKDAVAYLKLLVNPREDQSLLRILSTPPRGLAQKAVDTLKKLHGETHRPLAELLGAPEFAAAMTGKAAAAAAELSGQLAAARASFAEPGGLAAKIGDFLRAVGYLDGLQRMYKDFNDALKRRENIDEFISAVAQFEQRSAEPVTLAGYLESFALLEENDRTAEDPANDDAVTLSTVHAAKGLEYPVVFCVAMEYGLFPHERAVEEGNVEEELRLFYVAITRARERLFLSRAGMRMQRGVSRVQNASPFLDFLPEATVFAKPEDLVVPMGEDELRQAFADIFSMFDDRRR